MGLTTFSLMMMVLVLSFVPPEEVKVLVAALQGALARVGSRPARPARPPAEPGELVLTP